MDVVKFRLKETLRDRALLGWIDRCNFRTIPKDGNINAVINTFDLSIFGERCLVHQPRIPRRVDLREADDITSPEQRLHLRRQAFLVLTHLFSLRHAYILNPAEIHAGTLDAKINLRRS